MSVQVIQPESLVDLSIEEQQLLSGGARGIIKGRAKFRYGGRTYPATIFIRVRNLPSVKSDYRDEEDTEEQDERDY